MKKTITDYNLNNKTVIIRVDFNVPIKDGKIVDDNRIVNSLETIKYAINNNAKVVLLSHLGRIKEESDKENNTLKPVALRLSELLNKNIYFVEDMDFSLIKSKIDNIGYGEVILLENTRFYDLDNKKESSNDLELAKNYASLGDIFINDAFGTIHRAHASNVGVGSLLPNGIGFLIEDELNKLSCLDEPDREYTVILGGSKVSDKIKIIENLITKCDHLVVGGGLAFTFLKAKGYNIGKSIVEDEYLDLCKDMINKYPDKLLLPLDVVASKEFDSNGINKDIDSLSDDDIGLDLGTKTISNIKDILSNTKTVMANGPLGYYEIDKYQTSTKEILTYLVENNIKTILGGGDIVACSSKLGLKDKVYHASTGGGATLEYLEGKKLPGLEIIQEK